jgi:hypothetical protein
VPSTSFVVGTPNGCAAVVVVLLALLVLLDVELPQPLGDAAANTTRIARKREDCEKDTVAQRYTQRVVGLPQVQGLWAICRRRVASRLSLCAAATIVVTAAMVATSAAPATATPAIGCGKVRVHHKRYSVRAHVLSCSKARRWSIAFLARGQVPAGYDCQRFSPKITRVRFVCTDPSTATSSDGPHAFSASA